MDFFQLRGPIGRIPEMGGPSKDPNIYSINPLLKGTLDPLCASGWSDLTYFIRSHHKNAESLIVPLK